MATIRPFAALRPKPELAAQICELPYDVMSSEEARQIAKNNPLSFLHVSKPEIDLPPSTDIYAPEVYEKGRANFEGLIQRGALRQDHQPCFYLYRQTMNRTGDQPDDGRRHEQVGLVAVASCEEYLAGVIKKHELTRPDKEDDRVRHIETLNSQTGPVFLVYRASATIDEYVGKATVEPPEIDFTAADGVRHTAWPVADKPAIGMIEEEFARIPSLYIADGHHRSAAAARVYQSRRGSGQSGSFLSVIFPHNQVQILPYNRVVKDLNGLSADGFLAKLRDVTVGPEDRGQKTEDRPRSLDTQHRPSRRHEFGLYLSGHWHPLLFRPELTRAADPAKNLDVTLLQQHVLEPMLAISDPRTSKRISFVGGIRGTGELERLVNSGEFACAFAMFPTGIEELMQIADCGGLMPPKSTWFEPKLRDGMFCHMLENGHPA